MTDNSMFQKTAKGYSHVDKTLFIKQPTTSITPFSVERQLVDNFVELNIPVNFTDIEGSLYLCGSQLVDLFGVSSNYITQHLNNIYGEYLDRNGIFTVNDVQVGGVTKCDPPSFIIYQLPIEFSSTNQHGSFYSNNIQQVLFYHHDLIVELAHRLNNNRARAISQYIKNLIHDYHRNMFVVHQDINLYPKFKNNLLRIANNFTPERHFMADVNNWLHELAILLPDNWNPDGTINYQKVNDFKRKAHTNAHYYTAELTPIQILAYRSDPNVISFGQENYRGTSRPWNSEVNNVTNYLKLWELRSRTGYLMAVISSAMSEIVHNGKTVYGSDILKKMVHDIDRKYGYNNYYSWQECPEVVIPKLLNISELRIDFKLKVQRYYELFPRKRNLNILEKQEFDTIEKEIGDVVSQEIDMNVDTDQIGIYVNFSHN